MDIHLHGVHRKLRYEALAVKASKHAGTSQNGKLRLPDILILPAGFLQSPFRHLKRIAQQSVILVEIIDGQLPDEEMIFIHVSRLAA